MDPISPLVQIDNIAHIGWSSHACLSQDAPQHQNMITQLESIWDEAFGSMQHIQRDFRMQLDIFEKLNAGPSLQTDVPHEVSVQRVYN